MSEEAEEKGATDEFKAYYVSQYVEARPYVKDEDVSAIKVSTQDSREGHPKEGDFVARHPDNHEDLWLVTAERHYRHHQEAPVRPSTEPEPEPEPIP